ncbi:MAG: hypothetical protein HKM24_07895, partial [Gammaproteobacteria bacterium]|nr:hypothetical protein [Gammaproteobacteria bacterium]
IKSGHEAGAVVPHQIGTQAVIQDWFQDRDGLLGISVMGGRRFRLYSTHRQPNGLYLGRAMLLKRETPCPVDPSFQSMVRMLRAMVKEMAPADIPGNIDYSNATSVGMRLAEILPIDMAAKQLCLEFYDPNERLEYLAPLIDSLRSRVAQS